MGRNFSSVAVPTTITANINDSATSITLASVSGFPTPPFSGVLDPGQASEEIVTVTNVVGTVATVARGQDNSAAVSHSAGATFRHMATGRDLQESQDHISASTAVHGLTTGSAVVGTKDAQSLDKKTFASLDGTGPAITVRAFAGQATNLAEVKDSGGSNLVVVTPAGQVQSKGVSSGKSVSAVASDTATPAVTAQAVTSQVSSVLSVKDAGGAERFGVAADGAVTTGAAITTTAALNGATCSVTSGAAVGSLTSSGAISGASVASTGAVTAGTTISATGNISGAGVAIVETAAAEVPLSVKGAASQSANLVEVRTSTNTLVGYIDKSGNAVFTNSFPTGSTRIAGGSTPGTTNQYGDYNLINAIITATGWSAVDRVQVMNGDAITRPNITMGLTTALPAASGNVRVSNASTGAAQANSAVRFEWMAWGH